MAANKKSMKSRRGAKPLWLRVFGGLFYLSALALILLGATFFGWIQKSPLGSALVGQVLHPKPPQDVFEGQDSLYLLLLGCDVTIDERTKEVLTERARADMMLVTRLDFKNKAITGVSIPRDTAVSIPGYRSKKINAYHALAKSPAEGAELTRQAVEKILPGVRIDRVVTLDYVAFQRMVDLVGGVNINVEKRMKYDDNAGGLHIDLKPGLQKLDGNQAMGFVRFRHDDNDFARQQRQKQFLIAFKNALISNPGMFMAVLNESMNVVGGALSVDEVASVAMFAKNVPSSSIRMGQIPVRPGRGTNLRVDEDRLPETLAEFNMVGTRDGATRVSRL
jgi:LCP family protein required for cell wall assembly